VKKRTISQDNYPDGRGTAKRPPLRNFASERHISDQEMSMRRAMKRKQTRGGSKGDGGKDSGDEYSQYSKNLYKEVDITKSRRAQSAKPVNIHGLQYKF
jgi:hypothetical protein